MPLLQYGTNLLEIRVQFLSSGEYMILLNPLEFSLNFSVKFINRGLD